MAIIRTELNSVRLYEPEPGHDLFVETLIVPGDSNAYRRMWVKPITHWQDAVDWAVGMADFMRAPIIVAAIGGDSFLRLYDDRVRSALAAMSDQQRGEMRQLVVTTCCETMRDCDDPDIRAEMFDALSKLKVIRP